MVKPPNKLFDVTDRVEMSSSGPDCVYCSESPPELMLTMQPTTVAFAGKTIRNRKSKRQRLNGNSQQVGVVYVLDNGKRCEHKKDTFLVPLNSKTIQSERYVLRV